MSPRADDPLAGRGTSSGAGDSDTLQPDKIVTVLSVSASEADHHALGHVFRHTKWTLLESRGCLEALALLRRGPVPVVICDCSLPDGHWTDIIKMIAELPAPPLVIVSSRLADDRLWAEVMGSGGYDVLEKPFNHAELVRVVSLAWLAWKAQRQRVAEAGKKSAADEP